MHVGLRRESRLLRDKKAILGSFPTSQDLSTLSICLRISPERPSWITKCKGTEEATITHAIQIRGPESATAVPIADSPVSPAIGEDDRCDGLPIVNLESR